MREFKITSINAHPGHSDSIEVMFHGHPLRVPPNTVSIVCYETSGAVIAFPVDMQVSGGFWVPAQRVSESAPNETLVAWAHWEGDWQKSKVSLDGARPQKPLQHLSPAVATTMSIQQAIDATVAKYVGRNLTPELREVLVDDLTKATILALD